MYNTLNDLLYLIKIQNYRSITTLLGKKLIKYGYLNTILEKR